MNMDFINLWTHRRGGSCVCL